MKAWLDELVNEKTELQIAPLIDVVFLLLIYFMVSSSLKRSEADLSLTLPSEITSTTEIKMPDEQIIEVLANGYIVLNDKEYRPGDADSLSDLEYTLMRYKRASDLVKGGSAMITIAAADESKHERVIDVLNACAGAEIQSVTFGSADED